MRRVKRFFSLPPDERRLLLRALYRLSTTCCKLHLLPPSKVRALLADHFPQNTAARKYSQEQIAWAVRVAARYVPTANCLPQAIVAKQFLEEQGLHPALRIGVQPPGLQEERRGSSALSLKAHAWVELDGRIVLGEDENKYETLVGAGVTPR